jgi:hypothetical protein
MVKRILQGAMNITLEEKIMKLSQLHRSLKKPHFRFLSISTVAIIFCAAASAQKPTPTPSGPANVKVVNTTTEPIPVSGTVNIGNLGTGGVPVSGTVAVENSGTNPLRVQDVSEALRQPYHKVNFLGPVSGVSTVTVTYETVPAGKALVVEHVSGYTSYASTNPLPTIQLKINNSPFYMLPARTWADNSPGFRLWLYSEQIHLYVTAGQTLSIEASGLAESWIHLNGYYVDAP